MTRRFSTDLFLVASTLALASIATNSTPAASQTIDVDTEYDVERFRLSTDRGGILDVELAEALPHLELELSAWFGYADDPLNVYVDTPNGRERRGSLVSHRLAGNIIAAVGLFDRLEIALDLPLVFSQSEDLDNFMQLEGPAKSFGLGDVRVYPKFALLQGKTTVAVAVGLTLPTARGESYLGDGGLTFVPELLVSRRVGDETRLGLNLGYRAREQRTALNLEVDDEFYGHLGAGHMLTDAVELDATFSLATAANDFFQRFNRNHSELRAGIALHIDRLIPFVAAGVGTSEGFGTPDWRALVGVRLAVLGGKGGPVTPPPLVRDTDGDGITDDVDQCVDQPENINGVDDSDGCPEIEQIGDADGDGVLDNADQCPNTAEDADNFEDGDGCPDLDNDLDGVLDTADNCMNVPGPVENRGCPDADSDGDSVVDRSDNCPNEPGTVENHGCKEKQLVVLSGNKLDILDRVFFRTNKAIIVRRSYPLLNNVAQVLNNHPEIPKVLVEGHTDARGNDAYNKSLSQRRAEAVREYLIGKGVAGDRLEAVGFGEEKPIEDNGSREGRAANRRVEFNLLGTGDGVQKEESGPGADTIDN